ncbi:MAG: hypothetical protein EPN37_01600 [Chitinophagaceae bacterium]|jgi:hypothetical protein|nr:MAG: hypothetical protein EPN37_01600 [Chitinophagaceae bacterium]
MDGRLIPEHPDELESDINMNEALAGVPRLGDYGGGNFGSSMKKQMSTITIIPAAIFLMNGMEPICVLLTLKQPISL